MKGTKQELCRGGGNRVETGQSQGNYAGTVQGEGRVEEELDRDEGN